MAENSGDTLDAKDIPVDVQRLRTIREAEDKKEATEAAKDLLKHAASISYPTKRKTKQRNMNYEERSLMQQFIMKSSIKLSNRKRGNTVMQCNLVNKLFFRVGICQRILQTIRHH